MICIKKYDLHFSKKKNVKKQMTQPKTVSFVFNICLLNNKKYVRQHRCLTYFLLFFKKNDLITN